MPGVTTKTIAADLGLTTAAVSIALNPPKSGTSKVSAATAARVRAYAAKLNYRPSLASRAMKFRQMRQIGFLVESDFGVRRRPPTVEMPAIFGLNDFLDAKGWHLNIIQDEGERRDGLQLPRYLQEKGLDGVIVCSRSQKRDDTITHDLKRFSIPAVFLNATREFNCVGLNDRWGGALATRHLIDLGHRNIVFFGRNSLHSSLGERLSGYRQVMETEGLTPFSWVQENAPEDELDYPSRVASHHALGQWFVREIYRRQRPTAIFCYDDGLALILLRGLHEAGISVPGEVSVMGFNDMPLIDMLTVSLTTVRSDFYSMGRLAGEFLFKLMENPAEPLPSIMVEPELVLRETTRQLSPAK
jgi:DNA-binding LacI/PurR family transcriptional regulator